MLPLENSESPFKDVFSNTHEVTAETKENRTIYTQVFEIDNDPPLKMFFLIRMKSQQKRKKTEQYTHRYLKLIMASRKDAFITGIPYVICQQANMLFIFVVGNILPRLVI